MAKLVDQKVEECLVCETEATHFPVVGFFGQTETYCCQCFGCSGWLRKTECVNYDGEEG